MQDDYLSSHLTTLKSLPLCNLFYRENKTIRTYVPEQTLSNTKAKFQPLVSWKDAQILCKCRSRFLYCQQLLDLVSCFSYLLLLGPPIRPPHIAKEYCTWCSWFQFSNMFLSVLFLTFKTDTMLGLSQGAEKDVTGLHWLFDLSFLAHWLVEC